MARSNEDLAIAALAYLVKDSIRSLDESGPYATAMKTHFAIAKEYVIEEYDWPQCRVISPLVLTTGVNTRGWAYAYQYPSDSLKVWAINDGSKGLGYSITPFELGMSDDLTSDRTYVFTDLPSAYIRYSSSRVGIGQFSAQIFDLMALQLAIRTCMLITKDKVLKRDLEAGYKEKLSKVKTLYSNLEPEQTNIDYIPEFISVRSE